MVRNKGLIAKLSAAVGALLLCAAAVSPASAQIVEGFDMAKLPPAAREKVRVNAGAVSILVSGATCTCARFTEDIRNVVNDVDNPRPGGVRMVPVLGEGGLQNLKDTLFLRGINMSIVDESTLRVLRESNPSAYGDISERLRYITKLYNAELHILARKDIANIAQLNGKAVSFDYKDSETDLVAGRVFRKLGIKPKITNDDQRYALKRLAAGEIAAVVVSTGAPQDILTHIKAEDGLHLLPVSEASVPGVDFGPVLEEFLPTELTNEHYPNLIPQGQSVATVASRVVLAIYNWDPENVRYKRNGQFVREFFSRIDEFRNSARHPKWKDVNLAAEVPGWKRFKPAQDWLDKNAGSSGSAVKTSGIGGGAPSTQQKAAFDQYMAQRQSQGGNVSSSEKEALFSEFQKFMEKRGKQ